MTIDHLICWCAVHNVTLKRTMDGVSAIAYDMGNNPITRTTALIPVETLGRQEDDFERAIAVCDMLAEELCLLKPSIAFKLNNQ